MAKVSTVNLSPATGAIAMFNLLVFLRDQMGFSITQTSDGTTPGTNTITSGAAVAGGLGNNDAYFTAVDPGGEYSVCIQRATTNINWEIAVSALDGFTGGGATTRPTATDEQSIHNTTFFLTDGTYRQHLTGDTTPIGATVGVYPWRCWTNTNGSGNPYSILAHEPLAVGSYPELVGTRAVPTTGEPDPSLWIIGASGNIPSNPFALTITVGAWQGGTTAVRSWFCMNGTNGQSESFVSFQGAMYDHSPANSDHSYPQYDASSGVGTDPRDGADSGVPILLARVTRLATQVGPKGFTATIRLQGIDRDYPDSIDVGGERFVYCNDLLIPFENGTTPLT